MLKYVLFGTGNYYDRYIDQIKSKVKVVALFDNSIEKINLDIGGIRVYSTEVIEKIVYDKVLLLASNVAARQMYNQLVSLGVDSRKIQFVDEFFAEHYGEVFEVHQEKKRIIYCCLAH